jgi:putative component of membrane protein insertase Oxa1/YidC/SpoIIIJ protein YidD
MKLVLVLFILPAVLYAQSDWQRWGKAEISYQLSSSDDQRNPSNSTNSISEKALSAIISAYWILISDVDGDNCAFSPTCSSFFIESVKETNLFQGILMFSDRLTRDTDFIGRELKYPLAKNGKFYDIPSNYKLDPDIIKYIPPLSSVNNE